MQSSMKDNAKNTKKFIQDKLSHIGHTVSLLPFLWSWRGKRRQETLKMKLKVENSRINVKEVLLLKISFDVQFHSFHRACVVSDLTWFQYTMRFPKCRELMIWLLAKTLTRVSQARHLLSHLQVLPWITVTVLNLDRLVWATESPEATRAIEMKELD